MNATLLSLMLLTAAPPGSTTIRRFGLFIGANQGGAGRVALRYAHSDAEQRHPRDERNEKFVGPRPDVAQAYVKRKRVKHRRDLTTSRGLHRRNTNHVTHCQGLVGGPGL